MPYTSQLCRNGSMGPFRLILPGSYVYRHFNHSGTLTKINITILLGTHFPSWQQSKPITIEPIELQTPVGNFSNHDIPHKMVQLLFVSRSADADNRPVQIAQVVEIPQSIECLNGDIHGRRFAVVLHEDVLPDILQRWSDQAHHEELKCFH